MQMRIATKILLLIFASLTFAGFASACPVCFSAPDSAETRGMTLAILFLLGTVGIVLCGVAAFFMYLVAKQKEVLPEQESLAEISPEPVEAENVGS